MSAQAPKRSYMAVDERDLGPDEACGEGSPQRLP
jgi:hypothetical protein